MFHTIWRFIDVLKKEQDLTDWKINQKAEDDEEAPSSPTKEVEGLRQTVELMSYDECSACRTTVRLPFHNAMN